MEHLQLRTAPLLGHLILSLPIPPLQDLLRSSRRQLARLLRIIPLTQSASSSSLVNNTLVLNTKQNFCRSHKYQVACCALLRYN